MKILCFRASLCAAVLTMTGMLIAGEPAASKAKAKEAKAEPKTVEFFQAMEQDQIDVVFIPRNAKEARVLIENKTKQPLNVKLPDAFAGVPVLAQAGQAVAGGSSGVSQGLGGGMGGMGGMRGGGMFNIAPEKTGKLKVNCVCLDHGKVDPTPRMKYEIVPIEKYVKKPAVIELMKAFGQGKLQYDAVQAATWHLNNGLSWNELAAKTNGRRMGYGLQSYFQPEAIQAGMQLAQAALQTAEAETESENQPEESQSLGKQ